MGGDDDAGVDVLRGEREDLLGHAERARIAQVHLQQRDVAYGVLARIPFHPLAGELQGLARGSHLVQGLREHAQIGRCCQSRAVGALEGLGRLWPVPLQVETDAQVRSSSACGPSWAMSCSSAACASGKWPWASITAAWRERATA